MANGLPLSVKGVYKNLSFQTTKPDKPVELKLDKLLDKINEIFDTWASKPEKTQNLRDKWEDMSIKFSDKFNVELSFSEFILKIKTKFQLNFLNRTSPLLKGQTFVG